MIFDDIIAWIIKEWNRGDGIVEQNNELIRQLRDKMKKDSW